jgi:hypothetical protein
MIVVQFVRTETAIDLIPRLSNTCLGASPRYCIIVIGTSTPLGLIPIKTVHRNGAGRKCDDSDLELGNGEVASGPNKDLDADPEDLPDGYGPDEGVGFAPVLKFIGADIGEASEDT